VSGHPIRSEPSRPRILAPTPRIPRSRDASVPAGARPPRS
jgi:hypothetical protein